MHSPAASPANSSTTAPATCSGAMIATPLVEVGAHRAPVEREVEVVPDAAAAADAGVQVHEVEAAAALDRERDRRPVGLEVGHVAGDGVAADLGRDGPGARLVEVRGDHHGALAGERARGRPPKAAGGAGDQRHLAAEAAHRAIASARSASSEIASPNEVR
jgi:hypothetical protein